MCSNLRSIFSIGALLACAGTATAQTGDAKVTQLVADGALKDTSDAKKQGWDYALTLSANLALAQSDNVVGQPQGVSYLVGMGINGVVNYAHGPHELINTIGIIESFSKSPALDQVIKANDIARLESIYAYYFLPWIGGFGRLSFEAPLLTTKDLRAVPTDYNIDHVDGPDEQLTQESRVVLADAFKPFTMVQSLGVVMKPVDAEAATITVRVGGGGRETLASGVLLIKDNAATTTIIELLETDNVLQFGAEGALGIAGKFPEQRLTYGLDFGILLPFINNDDTTRGVMDLARIGFAAGATFSMWDWLGFTYQMRVLRDPQLTDDVQVQNNLFLTFKYDVIPAAKVEEAPKADPVADAQAAAAAAEARAAEAEARAKAAEERAKAAEEKAAPAPVAPAPAPATP